MLCESGLSRAVSFAALIGRRTHAFATALNQAERHNPSAQQRKGSWLRNGSGVAKLPRLRAGVATVGEVCGKICRPGATRINRCILNEVISAETTRPAYIQLQVTEISITGPIACGAGNRNTKRPVWGVAAVIRAEREHPKGKSAASGLDERGRDSGLRSGQGEGKGCMWSPAVNEPVFRKRKCGVDQVHQHINSRAVDLCQRYGSNVRRLRAFTDRERVAWTC